MIMLIAGLFLPSFDFNKNGVQASPQCDDGVDNDFNGLTDVADFPNCICAVDDDESIMPGDLAYYISYDINMAAPVDVYITSSCGLGAASSCSSYDGVAEPGCLTGWSCSATNTSASCFTGQSISQAGACINYVSPGHSVCTTPYEACGCTCCVTVGNACAADSDCCSNNCDAGGLCAAAFVCATAGNPCVVDADCCGGLVCNALLTCVAAPPPTCIANGSPCAANADCCSGICDIFGGSNLCIATSGGLPVCTTGGLIPCGRNCDVIATTGWIESDPCTLCHLVLMGQLIIEFLVKMAAVFALLALIGGGLIYVFSIGSAGTIEKAKGMIKYALLGFVVIFIAWAVITTILTSMGYMDPLGGDWHMMDC